MLNVWIGNLGKYNEGELVGEWLELPVSKKELDTFFKRKSWTSANTRRSWQSTCWGRCMLWRIYDKWLWNRSTY